MVWGLSVTRTRHENRVLVHNTLLRRSLGGKAILQKSRMIGSLAYDANDKAILKCYTEETR